MRKAGLSSPRLYTLGPTSSPATSGYLRLTGKGHAEDGDAAENALPADVADSLQPLPTEEAVLKGGQHNLDRRESRARVRSQRAAWTTGHLATEEVQETCSSLHRGWLTPSYSLDPGSHSVHT